MKYLVDANVLSEPTRAAPSASVIEWLRAHETELVIDVVVRGELEFGILQLPAGKRRERLEKWFASSIAAMNCLSLTVDTSETWARLLARLRKSGVAMPIKDSLIAASALTHGLTVATRNVHDFKNAGAKVIDPFTR